MAEGEARAAGEAANPHIAVDAVWLARRQEAILVPELAIVDAHNHLWDRAYYRYLFPEFLADLRSGHNVVGSVFVECHAMYRARGPETLRPVGETEFAAGTQNASPHEQARLFRDNAGQVYGMKPV